MHSSDIKPEKSNDIFLKEIFSRFEAQGSYLKGYPFGNGHIHDTFCIETAENNSNNYILQRLNNRVFNDIPMLQENITRVTRHLRSKLSMISGTDLTRECLTLIASRSGNTYITDDSGSFWRMYIFITGHRSYDIVDSPDKAFEGGKAIGKFQVLLADLPGEPLFETIPFFHDIEKRLETFNKKVAEDPAGRVKYSANEINDVLSRAGEMKVILRLGREGKIQLRITHNDTKFNNILLDEHDKALCIIDLDTVMPGYVHYDFGDAIRTAANTAAEDEADLAKVNIDISLFRAYAEGYLGETRNTLNIIEKEYLAFAPRLITYTIAVRFLTDYIDGDNYFRIHHPHHNLQRARAQLQLVKSMEEQYSAMQDIINELS
jgi:Ser/Thr protein kinase RdoA (MazF antagonist)